MPAALTLAELAKEAPTTATLYSRALAARAEEEKFDPAEIRLSEAGLCGRRQTLRALGYAGEEPDERSLSIFRSGDEHEDAIYHLWAERYPRRVRRQVRVWSPFGTGHIDIWVAPLRRIVESKSTTEKSRSRLPMEHNVDQVTMYLHFWGNAHDATAEIAYRIKETGEILSFPVRYDPDRAQALVRRLQAVQGAIHVVGEPLPIPEGYGPAQFPCAWHTPQGVARCPFWQHCYGATRVDEDERAGTVAQADHLEVDAARYVEVCAQRAEAQRALSDVEAEKASIEDVFAGVLDAAGANVLIAGRFTVTRKHVAGRVTTDVAAAIDDGVVSAEALAPYTHQGNGYWRWKAREA